LIWFWVDILGFIHSTAGSYERVWYGGTFRRERFDRNTDQVQPTLGLEDQLGGCAKANGTMFDNQYIHHACVFDMNALQ